MKVVAQLVVLRFRKPSDFGLYLQSERFQNRAPFGRVPKRNFPKITPDAQSTHKHNYLTMIWQYTQTVSPSPAGIRAD